MDRKVKIISVSGCPWCTKAINLAKSSGFQVEIQKMSWGDELREVQERHPGWKTVPMIYTYNGDEEVFIGGYTDFESFVRGDVG